MRIYIAIGDVSVELDDEIPEAHSLDGIESMLARVSNTALTMYREIGIEIIDLSEDDV